MSKYFKVSVDLAQTVAVEVAASDQADAIAKAKEIALRSQPDARVLGATAAILIDCAFEVGGRLRHGLFGHGEVLKVTRTTNAADQDGFRLRVKFDSGSTKDLHYPSPHIHPESPD